MNSLTKVLLEDLLEVENKKVTAIYGGGFKPPTKGHYNVVEKAAEQNPEIDDIIIYVGGGERDGITQGESIQIWELYKKYLPLKTKIEPSKAPVGDILRYAKEHPDEEVLWIIGARENNPEDFADIASRTRTIDKYPNLQLRVIQTAGGVSGTAARKAVRDNNKEQFFHLIPDIEEKEQVWDIVSPIIKEGLMNNIKSKFKTFISAVKQENKETKEAVGLLIKAAKGDIKLSDFDKEQIGDQLKDVLKLVGLTAIATMPGGFIAAALIKLFKAEHLITPSSMLNEGRYDSLTRIVVKDILNDWKEQFNGTSGDLEFEEDYETTNSKGEPINFELYAVLKVKETKGGTYKVDGGADPLRDPAYLEVKFQVDPRDLPQKWEDIYMDLTDVVRHEIEHMTQQGSNVISSKEMSNDEILRNLINLKLLPKAEYFKLEQEIDAMLQGMYLKAKKSKTPFKDVINDYFDKVKLSKKDRQDILDIWKNRAKALSLSLNELVTNTDVICDNCGWEWPIADGGDDLYICHKCGHDNNPDLEEGTCGYDTDVKTGKKLNTPGGLEEGRPKKKDPKKGTGKKPEGSGRRLYTDEDPKDTVRIKFKTKEDIVDTLNKKQFKAKSHARQSQVINLIHQRVRAAYGKAKDPEVKARLKRALDYIESRKESSKKKTERLRKMKEASDPQAGTALPYGSGFAPVKENDPFGINAYARELVKEVFKQDWNLQDAFVSLSKFMIDNGMKIQPLPKIKVIKDDEENASNLLGKTAYYNPMEKSITLYTMNRHPKDILRSFSHEMVHHEQNLDNRLNNINTTNTNEDGDLPEIEREAYEKGNMMLRNWEDSIKNV